MATFIQAVVRPSKRQELTHIVHLYGRFPRKTSNSKPTVNTVSQLRLLQLSVRAFLLMGTNIHVGACNNVA